jgi:hypothetical protein
VGSGSFEGALSETLYATYAWSFRALDELLSERIPPNMAGRVEWSLVDMIDACDARSDFDASAATLREALVRSFHAARILASRERPESGIRRTTR